jgi:hypothetical protein
MKIENKLMKIVIKIILMFLLISPGSAEENNMTQVNIVYSAKSEKVLLGRFKKDRIVVTKLKGDQIIIENRRGSAVNTWEYYQYHFSNGFWRLSWVYLSINQLVMKRADGETVIFTKPDGKEVALPADLIKGHSPR